MTLPRPQSLSSVPRTPWSITSGHGLGLSNLPAVIMVADVCREELLFEMDAEVAFDPSMKGF